MHEQIPVLKRTPCEISIPEALKHVFEGGESRKLWPQFVWIKWATCGPFTPNIRQIYRIYVVPLITPTTTGAKKKGI